MQLANPIEAKNSPTTFIKMLVGKEALEHLSDEDFLDSWDVVYHNCPWATVFQSKEFVATWYKIFQNEYKAIIIKATCGKNLIGLLTLAQDKEGIIVGAGSGLAEYHVWLSRVSDGDNFIQNALLAVINEFPKADLLFRFLPNGTPLNWINENKNWERRCLIRIYERPLMDINEAAISQELRKKNRREKLNRLKRLGTLKFERITDAQTFSSIFDELAIQYDFRKGAMFNKSVFHSPLPKQFLIELFSLGFFHTTLLKLNDEIIASHVGAISQSWIHLQGLNTHSPLYARYSPGILHFLMLGKILAEEGFEIFDLTPGGDSYKENLATKHDTTYELRVTGSLKSHIKCSAQKKVYDFIIKDKENIFNKLRVVGLNPTEVRKEIKSSIRKYRIFKERIQQAKKHSLKSLIAEFLHSFTLHQKHVTYKLKPITLHRNSLIINRNSLHDLLKYNPMGGKLTKWEFLSEAMEKFEDESHVYTYSEDSQLLFCLWQKKIQTNRKNEKYSNLTNKLPEGALLLYDIYYHPTEKDKLQDFMLAAVCKATSDSKTDNLFIIDDLKDAVLSKIINTAGLLDCVEPASNIYDSNAINVNR